MNNAVGPAPFGIARDVLLQATTRRSIEEALLAEVLALRTILLNLHFATG